MCSEGWVGCIGGGNGGMSSDLREVKGKCWGKQRICKGDCELKYKRGRNEWEEGK